MATDAHVFQITNTAALMCSQLPLPAGFDPVAFFDRWQTLIGAAVGGLLGVVGALIVASRGTRRERRIAASVVLPEAMSFRAANEAIERVLAVSYLTKLAQKTHACRLLLKQRPKVRAMHSAVISQLYDVDSRLYSHLFQCQMIHEEFEAALELFRTEANAAKAPVASVEDAASSVTLLDVRATTATHAWAYCVEHASLANYYLDRFIFRPWPVWAFRLRMRLFPNDLDRRSAHLLATGNLLVDANSIPSPSIDEKTSL